ncbi:MAG: HlyD family secretion protein [Alphaproteobacteria bacterium]
MRNAAVILVAALLLTVGAGAGWYWWTEWRFIETTDDAYVHADTSVISPKIEGYIKKVRVRDNQPVEPGDVLFVIDDRDFAAKAARAEAAVATAEATVATYANRLGHQQAMIEQAAAAVETAGIDLDRARLDHRRYAALVTSDFASRQRFETAEAESRRAQAALDKARAALVAERNQLAVIESQKREEEARLAQTRADLVLARNDLDGTVIKAPFAGIVGNRAGRVGQYVKPGTQLAALVPLPHVYVTANFKETQLTHMQPGQQAEITVDAYPDRSITGTIESFSPASGAQFSLLPPDNATGNFTKVVQRVPVRIGLPRDEALVRKLRPGLSVTVSVDTRNAPSGDTDVAATARIGGAER